MTLAQPFAPPAVATMIDRLQIHGAVVSLEDVAAFEAFAQTPGNTLVLFSEDPARVPEAWDLVVVLPEVLKELGSALTAAVLPPEPSRALASRYAITVWPALLFLRDGGFVGTIEGLKDWEVYSRSIPAMLSKPLSRPLPQPVFQGQCAH